VPPGEVAKRALRPGEAPIKELRWHTREYDFLWTTPAFWQLSTAEMWITGRKTADFEFEKLESD
jgi:hypothetical protein